MLVSIVPSLPSFPRESLTCDLAQLPKPCAWPSGYIGTKNVKVLLDVTSSVGCVCEIEVQYYCGYEKSLLRGFVPTLDGSNARVSLSDVPVPEGDDGVNS